ncbi:hypothetical protein WJX84_006815 [Apatococcus fuscideae]|uniref:Uncharacterized protein n=1 Tax=Apatococcus fuscideae TaxID=2026836 RepID=A0AAW1RRU0_9CHLO
MRYKWSALTLTQSSQVPSGRFYLGLAALDANDNVCSMDLKTTIKKKSQEHAPMAFATGASVHTPTMECSDESWTLSWDLDRMLVKWDPQTPLPFGFYHNTLVAWNDTVFTFGGHLCGDTQGHLPYRYLNTVQALTVPAVIAKDLPTQSAASLSSNGKNRGAQTQGLHLASAGSLDRELKSLRSS